MAQLPICQHCHTEWTYKDTVGSLFRLQCSYCGKKNHFSRQFRWREPIFFLLVMGINFFILPILNISFILKILIISLILFMYIATLPFGLKLTKEEEPYF